jgi:thioesterase domain-containing protein
MVGKKMKDIIVADTIGLCDTEWKEQEVIDLIKDRVSSNVQQVHAVFVVLDSGRLKQDFARNIKQIMAWLKYHEGTNYVNFAFVITHCEMLTEEKQAKLQGSFASLCCPSSSLLLQRNSRSCLS